MDFIISIVLGVACIIIGIMNMKGNISTLHSYHRHRVSEENRLPFGRLIGIGTIIMGAAIVLFGVLSYLSAQLKMAILTIMGMILLFVGLAIGLVFTVYAMIKYNKGIF